MKEENPFEDPQIARQWISAIESPQRRSREKELYPFLENWIREIAPNIIVEIGSGQGVCSSQIGLSSAKYIGIEPSNTLLERARELYSTSNKEFIIGDAYNVPLPDLYADAVFSMGVWFHVKNLDKAHNEISRILKKNGEILIFTANPDTREIWESWFDDPIIEGKKVEGRVKVPGGCLSRNILYFHTRKEITDSLEKNGFRIKSIDIMGLGSGDRPKGTWIVIRAIK